MPLKLDHLLPDADRETFLAFVRHPATTVAAAHQWLMDRGVRIGRNAVYAFVRRERPAERVSERFDLKIDRLLKPRERAEYAKLVRQPQTTFGDLKAFLAAHGHPNVGTVAIRTHRNRLRQRLRTLRTSAAFARDLAQVVLEYGPEAFRGGAVAGVDQQIMERVFQLHDLDQIDPREFGEWARSLTTFATLRTHLTPGAAGNGEKGKPNQKPLDGVALSDKVRRILGVPLPGEPTPGLPPPPRPAGPSSLSPVPRGEGRGEGPGPGMTNDETRMTNQ